MNLGIYIQVPFCQTKCTYCNFHTGVVATSRFAPYIASVTKEVQQHTRLYQAAGISLPNDLVNATVDTVYIGGGTPSLLNPADLHAVLEAIRSTFSGTLTEVTLEADPETIDASKAAAWARAGIDRVSFGAQSFSDEELIAAGRMHRREDLYRAAPTLRDAGITNISFDLIAGLPRQTLQSWRRSLEELIAMHPSHISIYMMEIDEGSRLGREVLSGGKRYSADALPSDEQMADSYDLAQQQLAAAGYVHYEISNWALPGFESRHNLKYWRREPYLGFGAGAHSFSGTQRWANAHDAASYVASLENGLLPIEQLENVSSDQALEEELFLGLRQLAGIDCTRIEKEYGVSLAPKLQHLAANGLIEREGDIVRLAPEKLSISNEVFVELLR
ncbi:MAG TPA: radical SAM family heme chaperone HemW [Candidatus Acidoferrum sp.]|nr:radical SAM family heme chaperone HemW [Candidatus Acidoferrum sp.]